MAVRNRSSDEGGAVLILALVFVVVIAFMLVALVDLTGNDLLNSVNLHNQRSVEYAADGSVDAAIEIVRYNAGEGGLGEPCPLSSFTGPNNLNGVDVSVNCVPLQPTQPGTRMVQFNACPGSVSSCGSGLLQAVVTYTDFDTSNAPSVGYSASINSWLVSSAAR
jgi:hypothetical protein